MQKFFALRRNYVLSHLIKSSHRVLSKTIDTYGAPDYSDTVAVVKFVLLLMSILSKLDIYGDSDDGFTNKLCQIKHILANVYEP